MACAKRVFRLLGQLDLAFEPRLALIGDSGGGSLCATVSHRAQYEPGLTIERQVLFYPSLDYSLSQPSIKAFGRGYLLEYERILWMFDAYLQGQENRREVSPLFMDVTGAYPPTLIVTGEFDPLRDEGLVYARRLQEFGIPAEHRAMPGMIHAFLNLEALVPEPCRRTYAAVGRFLGNADLNDTA
jgi:acetyl esterase/lipase